MLVFATAFTTYAQGKKSTADSVVMAHVSTHALDSVSQHHLKKLDSVKGRLDHTMDSLRKKGLPVTHYQKKMDSINRRVKNLISLQALSAKAKRKTAKLNAALASPQDSLKKKMSRREMALQRKVNPQTSASLRQARGS